MHSRIQPKRLNKKIIAILAIAIAVIVAGIVFLGSRYSSIPQATSSLVSKLQQSPKEEFPDIDTTTLSATQRSIVELTKQAYKQQEPGTFYSQGSDEAWCANFVSWIMREAGQPYENPHSGSWRIPGTVTLREYYQSTQQFLAYTQQYTPKTGDTILYDNPSPFGQHVNFVLVVTPTTITTIGGNEPGGIRVHTRDRSDDRGVLGYGVL